MERLLKTQQLIETVRIKITGNSHNYVIAVSLPVSILVEVTHMNHYLFLGCSYEPVLLLRKLVLIFRFFFAIFLALNVNTVFVMLLIIWLHCVESARIQIYSGPHFPAFGQNTKRYGESLCIQSECRKMQTRITPNMNTFHSVLI